MKTFITRAEALARYKLTEPELDDLVNQGRVEAINLVDRGASQVVIYDDDLAAYVAERDITPDKFKHLKGNLLGINEATRKYHLNLGLISTWVARGILEIRAQEKNKKLVDEADVAYLATLGQAKKMRSGKKVFG